jgi:hypothetical protein
MQAGVGLLVSDVMPIYDHCLGYHHNYGLFYQLPNSNLFTHRMLSSREKPLVKTMAPGSIFHHIKLKTSGCNLFTFILLLCFTLFHPSLRDFILAINCQGIDDPLFYVGCEYLLFVCVGAANEIVRGSPTGLITSVLN